VEGNTEGVAMQDKDGDGAREENNTKGMVMDMEVGSSQTMVK
jgi:hypothetical protein